MQKPDDTAPIKLPVNDDDEILTRLNECERMEATCPNKDCPFAALIESRKHELKRSLVDHWLF